MNEPLKIIREIAEDLNLSSAMVSDALRKNKELKEDVDALGVHFVQRTKQGGGTTRGFTPKQVEIIRMHLGIPTGEYIKTNFPQLFARIKNAKFKASHCRKLFHELKEKNGIALSGRRMYLTKEQYEDAIHFLESLKRTCGKNKEIITREKNNGWTSEKWERWNAKWQRHAETLGQATEMQTQAYHPVL